MNLKSLLLGFCTLALVAGSLKAEARTYSYVNSPVSAAVLVAKDPHAHINLRAEPRPDAPLLGYGLVGDNIHLITYLFPGVDGKGWYLVQFDQSGAKGWIRADFVDNFAE
ncbi:MAG: SH3 domain-containing protein [Thermosynechococcaceae cyanobacterium]